ncbi:MAG: GNAT family N-acetyltransferase [Blastocatellia bacterium]|nr:GNAT family N-acetyltransferase [Blastocatellia bacterium]
MSETSPVVIRPATAADAAPLAALATQTFVDTFAQFNTPEDMEAYLASAFSPEIQAQEIADPNRITLLAEVAGHLAGYAQLNRGPALECVPGEKPLELLRLYVDRQWHGKKVAQALMEAYYAEARRGGYQTLWLCVWEHNHRAKAFYSKLGFVDVGSKIFVLGSDAQTDRVMVRPIFRTED